MSARRPLQNPETAQTTSRVREASPRAVSPTSLTQRHALPVQARECPNRLIQLIAFFDARHGVGSADQRARRGSGARPAHRHDSRTIRERVLTRVADRARAQTRVSPEFSSREPSSFSPRPRRKNETEDSRAGKRPPGEPLVPERRARSATMSPRGSGSTTPRAGRADGVSRRAWRARTPVFPVEDGK